MANNIDLVKQFKCVKCKHRFYAQEAVDLVCPSCKSDNITQVKENLIFSIMLKTIAFIAAAIVSYFVTPIFTGEGKTTSDNNVESVVSSVVNEEPIQPKEEVPVEPVEMVKEEIPQELVVEIQTRFDEVVNNNYIYSFDAHCNLDSLKKLTYELLDAKVDNVIMSNADGKFTNIQPSETGEYRFRVRVEEDGRVSEPMLVTGFNRRPIVKVPQLTKEALEDLINQRKSVLPKRNDIIKNVKIMYTSTLKEEKGQTNLQDVENQLLFGEWASVKVVDVDYNEMDQVKMILLDVIYP